MPGNHHLFATALDLDGPRRSGKTEGLDGHFFAFAGRLGNVTGGGQVGPVKIADDCSASFHLGQVTDEYRLVHEGAVTAMVAGDGRNALQGIPGLLGQAVSSVRHGTHAYVLHVVLRDNCGTDPVGRLSPDHAMASCAGAGPAYLVVKRLIEPLPPHENLSVELSPVVYANEP